MAKYALLTIAPICSYQELIDAVKRELPRVVFEEHKLWQYVNEGYPPDEVPKLSPNAALDNMVFEAMAQLWRGRDYDPTAAIQCRDEFTSLFNRRTIAQINISADFNKLNHGGRSLQHQVRSDAYDFWESHYWPSVLDPRYEDQAEELQQICKNAAHSGDVPYGFRFESMLLERIYSLWVNVVCDISDLEPAQWPTPVGSENYWPVPVALLHPHQVVMKFD